MTTEERAMGKCTRCTCEQYRGYEAGCKTCPHSMDVHVIKNSKLYDDFFGED